MYNREIKERFLDQITAGGRNRNTSVKYLDAIGLYEEEIGRDFAEMSFDEAIEAIRNIKIGTYDSATSVQGFVRNYVKWCEGNRVFGCVNPELKKISAKEDIDASRYLREMWFLDESDLINKMRTVRTFNDGYYEVVVLLFAWLGIGQDKILSIRPSDINLENRQLLLADGGVINFSEDIAYVISEYLNTTTSTRQHNGEPTVVYRDFYGPFISKFCKRAELGNDPLTDSQIGSAISEMNQDFVSMGNPGCFKYTNVANCGVARRIYELEQSGVDVLSSKNKELIFATARLDIDRYKIKWLFRNYKRAFNL